jgi:aspartate oxidase
LNEQRYLADFDTRDLQKEYHDIIIIGSGIAGVYTALEISEKYDIAIITKETIDISNSVLAQGGIAVSLGVEEGPILHDSDGGAGDVFVAEVRCHDAIEECRELSLISHAARGRRLRRRARGKETNAWEDPAERRHA